MMEYKDKARECRWGIQRREFLKNWDSLYAQHSRSLSLGLTDFGLGVRPPNEHNILTAFNPVYIIPDLGPISYMLGA